MDALKDGCDADRRSLGLLADTSVTHQSDYINLLFDLGETNVGAADALRSRGHHLEKAIVLFILMWISQKGRRSTGVEMKVAWRRSSCRAATNSTQRPLPPSPALRPSLTSDGAEGVEVLGGQQGGRQLSDELLEQRRRVVGADLVPADVARVEVALQVLLQQLRTQARGVSPSKNTRGRVCSSIVLLLL